MKKIDAIIDSAEGENRERICKLIGEKVQLFDNMIEIAPNTMIDNAKNVIFAALTIAALMGAQAVPA